MGFSTNDLALLQSNFVTNNLKEMRVYYPSLGNSVWKKENQEELTVHDMVVQMELGINMFRRQQVELAELKGQ